MRDKFAEYYRPTDKEFKCLWQNALFVLDTNVLLNLYRYSEGTRSELVRILREFNDKLWIPHQVAQEFLDSRLQVIHEQKKRHADLRERLSTIEKNVKNEIEALHKGARFEPQKLLEDLRGAFSDLKDHLNERENSSPSESNCPEDDEVWTVVEELFAGKVGDPYVDDKYKEIEEEGKRRKEHKVPPGYEDEGSGDLIIWLQIIDKAKNTDKPLLFITDDRKEDWWWKSHGKTVGPRPELVKEIKQEAGTYYYMYTATQFMKQASEYLKREISPSAINETEQLSSRVDEFNNVNEVLGELIQGDDFLTEEERSVLLMYFYEGYTLEEITQGLGHSEYQIREILKNSMQRLRWWLGPDWRKNFEPRGDVDGVKNLNDTIPKVDRQFVKALRDLRAATEYMDEEELEHLHEALSNDLESMYSQHAPREYRELLRTIGFVRRQRSKKRRR